MRNVSSTQVDYFADLSKSNSSEHARCAACDGDRQERRVHGADVRSTAREEVVRVEVEDDNDSEGLLP